MWPPWQVLLVELVDAATHATVGHWLTTLKMLVVDPRNVYSRGRVETAVEETADGHASYALRGTMVLRGPGGRLLPRCDESTLELDVAYFHDPKAPSQEDLLRTQPMTALEQLQENSAETSLRLGDVGLCRAMLEDFPLLFDVRACSLRDANAYLSELFAGYKGKGDLLHHRFGATKLLDSLRAGAGDDGDSRKKRSDNISIRVLDLKEVCKLDGALSVDGLVSRLLSRDAVGPLLPGPHTGASIALQLWSRLSQITCVCQARPIHPSRDLK